MSFETDVALGVKVFTRTDKLEQLFNSIEESPIEKVYVADDGNTEEREYLYTSEGYTFDITLLDLEYDAGLGYGRKRIVDELTEDYLLIVDSDHEIPSTVTKLYDVLESDGTIGGVSGMVMEDGFLRGMCHDIYIEDGYLIKDIRNEKERESIAGVPFVEFDFVPNVALFRKTALNDYVWDSEFVIEGEHLDFYIGHLDTDWRFGVCPEVLFPHYPGGSSMYMNNRGSPFKAQDSAEYLREKWGLKDVLPRDYWLNFAYIGGALPEVIQDNTPFWFQSLLRKVNLSVWKFKYKYVEGKSH